MNLYALGSNGHGQLSLGHTEDTATPTACILPPSLTSEVLKTSRIVCGGNHTLLLTSQGDLFGCGSNEHGQLGLPDNTDVLSLTQLYSDKHWTQVACGFSYSLLVQDARRVYALGFNDKGSLGLGSTWQTTELTELELPEALTIRRIKASVTHVVLQSSTGQLYGFGSGRRGALGSELMRQVNACTAMTLPASIDCTEIADYCLGQHWTALQTAHGVHVLTTSGGRHMQPGHLEACQFIAASWSTLHRVLADGSVCSIGRSDRSQHASFPHCLTQIAAGSEHCLALSEQGDVLAWGWNEHGNCGCPSLQDVAQPLTLGTAATWIAAGYATSFFYGQL